MSDSLLRDSTSSTAQPIFRRTSTALTMVPQMVLRNRSHSLAMIGCGEATLKLSS